MQMLVILDLIELGIGMCFAENWPVAELLLKLVEGVVTSSLIGFSYATSIFSSSRLLVCESIIVMASFWSMISFEMLNMKC